MRKKKIPFQNLSQPLNPAPTTILITLLFSPLALAESYYSTVTKLIIGWIMITIPLILGGAFYWAKKLYENDDIELTPYNMSIGDYIWMAVMTCLFFGGVSVVVG